mmetsp:Transcript_62020/g.102980  ORF Transcript_62020/g.102980 Transcript_62020/m.102980 type:complete len:93 (+) Transcript_62020:277-555(+)
MNSISESNPQSFLVQGPPFYITAASLTGRSPIVHNVHALSRAAVAFDRRRFAAAGRPPLAMNSSVCPGPMRARPLPLARPRSGNNGEKGPPA